MTDGLIRTIERKYIKPAKGMAKLKPVDASSIVLIDRRAGAARVLMGRRNPAARFMPGFFVFPGGRREKADAAAPFAGSLDARDIERLKKFTTRPTLSRLNALALGAVRETFEETGLRIGVPASPKPLPEGSPWAEFCAGGMVPTLDGLRFFARAITPPGRPRRFDTRFFLRDIGDMGPLTTLRPTPDSELVELRWVTLAEAAELESAEITQIILGELKVLLDGDMHESLPRPLFRAHYKTFQRVSL